MSPGGKSLLRNGQPFWLADSVAQATPPSLGPQARALKALYEATSAKNALVNVHQNTHCPDGQAERVRKERCFTLQLDHGSRKDQAKAALVEVLETEFRRYARLPTRAAEPLPPLLDERQAKRFLLYIR